MASNFIRDGWALALQPILRTAGYLLPVETEKPNLIPIEPGGKPLDISFDPDPNTSPFAPPPCPYPTIGGDITITHSPAATTDQPPDDVIEFYTATAETHLQRAERGKLMRDNKRDPDTNAWISGDAAMGQLVDSGVALIPMAILTHMGAGDQ